MRRASLIPQLTGPARQSQKVPESQPSRGATVLPFRSRYDRRRDDICDALITLAHAWRTLEISDEAGWGAFAADAATSLACHLRQHFESVRSAMIASGDPSPWTDGSTVDLLYRVREDVDGEHELADRAVDAESGNESESAANAVLLAFIAATDALRAAEDAWPFDDIVDVVSATDAGAAKTDVPSPHHAAQRAR